MYFIGVDHHKQASVMTVLDEDGRELKNGRVFNLREKVERFLEGYHPFTAVLEAGRSSYVMADLLRELGGEVKMANALQVKAIAHARIKTDKRDSRTLAQLLRADLIPEIYQRGEGNRRAQRVMRMRAYWVAKQTEVKNKIRALLAQQKEEIRLEVEKREDGLFSGRGVEFLTKSAVGGSGQDGLGRSDSGISGGSGSYQEVGRTGSGPLWGDRRGGADRYGAGFCRDVVGVGGGRDRGRQTVSHGGRSPFLCGSDSLDVRLGRADLSRAHHQAGKRLAEMGGAGSGLSGDQKRPRVFGSYTAGWPSGKARTWPRSPWLVGC